MSGQNRKIRFEIRDTGIGMSPDEVQKLFKPFVQADASTTRCFGGTGLGLAISKSLVQLMGGEIGVESEKGKGSLFWFEVPEKVAPIQEEAIALDQMKSLFEGKEALIVDDNRTNLKLLTKRLSLLGMKVEQCSNGEDSLRLLATKPHFDLAILDLMMPEMNGMTLATRIKDNPITSSIPLILLSSIGQGDLLEKGGRHCFAGILQKPLHLSLFQTTLARVLSQTNRTIAAPAIETTSTGASIGSQDRLILVVEDNEVNLRLICTILNKEGYATEGARNGAEALALMKSNKYSIIFMDVQMPMMDGIESTRLIREYERDREEKSRVIIALTANAMVGDRELYLSKGMTDYTSKPINKNNFLALIDRYISD